MYIHIYTYYNKKRKSLQNSAVFFNKKLNFTKDFGLFWSAKFQQNNFIKIEIRLHKFFTCIQFRIIGSTN